MTWMSKLPGRRNPGSAYALRPGRGSVQTAHFVRDGAPLCASARLNNGEPTLSQFKVDWGPLVAFDKKCRLCEFALRREEREARLARRTEEAC